MVDGKLFVGIGLEIEDIGGKTFEEMSDKVKKAMENNAKFDMSNQSASISPSASFGAYFCLGIDEFGTCYMEEGSAIINLGLEAEFETVVEAIVPIVQMQMLEIPVVGLPCDADGTFTEAAAERVAKIAESNTASIRLFASVVFSEDPSGTAPSGFKTFKKAANAL